MVVITYVSDLHLEFRNSEQIAKLAEKITAKPADWLCLAGDITCLHTDRDKLVEFLTYCTNYRKILMVLGNHEHYGGDFNQTASLVPEPIILLDRSVVEIDGYRVVGCTLWSEPDPRTIWAASRVISDFRAIELPGDDFNYQSYLKFHRQDRQFLEQQLSETKVDLVITHHAPLLKMGLSKPSESNSKFVSYFETDLIELVKKVKYWICGHTHHRNRVQVEDSTVLINCAGYPEEDDGFEARQLEL